MSNNKSLEFLKIINDLKYNSGFLNVSKHKFNNAKGYKWIYHYKDYNISSVHLLVLKYFVISRGLPWKIINNSKARKSIELEKSNYHLFDNGSGVLFVNIVDSKFHHLKNFWRYKFENTEIFDVNLNKLEKNIKAKGLPWIVLNEVNYNNSINLEVNFESGIYMVNKIRFSKYLDLFKWIFIYKENEEYKFLINDDLNSLKKEVIKRDFSWEIINENNFKKSLIDNEVNLNAIEHHKWASTGFFRVKKIKEKRCRQGFSWVYRFKENYKVISLSSTNLLELEKKVLNSGFVWKIIDKKLAENSLKENKLNLEKYGNSKNKTGINRVYKDFNKKSRQGFYWVYSYTINKKKKSISAVNLLKLKEKVIKKGLTWKIVDADLYRKSLIENRNNMKWYYD